MRVLFLSIIFLSLFAVPPTIKAVNQLVGAPVEREVTLECIVEVYPKPLNGWYRNEGTIELILLLIKPFSIIIIYIKIISIIISILWRQREAAQRQQVQHLRGDD